MLMGMMTYAPSVALAQGKRMLRIHSLAAHSNQYLRRATHKYGKTPHFPHPSDDTQLYVSLDPGNKADVSSSLESLENCIADIQLWMTSSFLTLI